MANEKDYFIEMSAKIGELCADIRAVLKRLEKGDERFANHEARISALEHGTPQAAESAVRGTKTHGAELLLVVLKYGGWIVAALVAVIMKLLQVQAPAITGG